MKDETKLKALKYLLLFGGVFGLPVIVLLSSLNPAAWGWQPPQPEYEGMLLSILVAQFILMILASRDPIRHIMFVWFVIISGFFHGGIMLYFSLIDEVERLHLVGDVPFTLGFSVLFLVLIPWGLLKQEQKKGSGLQ